MLDIVVPNFVLHIIVIVVVVVVKIFGVIFLNLDLDIFLFIENGVCNFNEISLLSGSHSERHLIFS